MKRYNLNNFGITPATIIAATAGVDGIVSAAVPLAQKIAWEKCCVVCSLNLGVCAFDPSEFPDVPKMQFTLGGFPLVTDDTLDPQVIEFRDAAGCCLARIEHCGIPIEAL